MLYFYAIICKIDKIIYFSLLKNFETLSQINLVIKSFLWTPSTPDKKPCGKTTVFPYKINTFKETKFPFKVLYFFQERSKRLRATLSRFFDKLF